MLRKNAANLLTRESILLAFLDLLQTEAYSRITITDITRRAGVSRNAYYRNYDSKEGILQAKMDELGEEIRERYQARPEPSVRGLLECCFAVCGENGAFLHTLCKAGQESMIRDRLGRQLEKLLQEWAPDRREYYETCFYLSGLYGIIIAWVKSGRQAPAERMAQWACQLMQPALLKEQ